MRPMRPSTQDSIPTFRYHIHTLTRILNVFLSQLRHYALRGISYLSFHSGFLSIARSLTISFYLGPDPHTQVRIPFVKRMLAQHVTVLFYHRVNDDNDYYFPATPAQVFGAQMEHLAANFTILPLDDAVAMIKVNDIPPNAVVLTFDDGYRDNFTYAFPVLKRLSLPATIFLTTGSIGSTMPLWHDRVFSAFRQTHVPILHAFAPNIPPLPLASLQQRLHAQRQVLEFLWTLDDGDRDHWIHLLNLKLRADTTFHPGLMLTWDHVRTMQSHGIAFGSHTISHPILSRISNEKAAQEIRLSKEILERELRATITSFAYPNGKKADFHQDTKEIVRDAGYACALTTLFGYNNSRTDPFELHRVNPPNGDIAIFAFKLQCHALPGPA